MPLIWVNILYLHCECLLISILRAWQANGSARVRLGGTDVIASVKVLLFSKKESF